MKLGWIETKNDIYFEDLRDTFDGDETHMIEALVDDCRDNFPEGEITNIETVHDATSVAITVTIDLEFSDSTRWEPGDLSSDCYVIADLAGVECPTITPEVHNYIGRELTRYYGGVIGYNVLYHEEIIYVSINTLTENLYLSCIVGVEDSLFRFTMDGSHSPFHGPWYSDGDVTLTLPDRGYRIDTIGTAVSILIDY